MAEVRAIAVPDSPPIVTDRGSVFFRQVLPSRYDVVPSFKDIPLFLLGPLCLQFVELLPGCLAWVL
jgi:hypothetical protein